MSNRLRSADWRPRRRCHKRSLSPFISGECSSWWARLSSKGYTIIWFSLLSRSSLISAPPDIILPSRRIWGLPVTLHVAGQLGVPQGVSGKVWSWSDHPDGWSVLLVVSLLLYSYNYMINYILYRYIIVLYYIILTWYVRLAPEKVLDSGSDFDLSFIISASFAVEDCSSLLIFGTFGIPP